MGGGVQDFDAEPEGENPSMKAARERAEKAEQKAKREKEIAEKQRKEAQAKAEKAQKEREQAIKGRKEAEEKAKKAQEAEYSAEIKEKQARIKEQQAREEERRAHEKAEKARDAEEQAKKQQKEIEREMKAAKEKADQALKTAAEELAKIEQEIEGVNQQKGEAERDRDNLKEKVFMLAKGIEPSYQPTLRDIADAKRRISFQPDKFHIAIAGSSGCGKSSLINSFRAISALNKYAAATGTTETTTKMERFPDPSTELPWKRFVWYDIPGAGTQNVNLREYAKTQALYVFDVVILVYGGRLLESDITTLRHCVEFGVPTFLVRSRADEQIRNLQKERDPPSDDEEGYEAPAPMTKTPKEIFEEATRKNLQAELKKAKLSPQEVYIVSNDAVRLVCKHLRKQATSTRRTETTVVEATETSQKDYWMKKANELAAKAKEGLRTTVETVSSGAALYQAPELVSAVLLELYKRRYKSRTRDVTENRRKKDHILR